MTGSSPSKTCRRRAGSSRAERRVDSAFLRAVREAAAGSSPCGSGGRRGRLREQKREREHHRAPRDERSREESCRRRQREQRPRLRQVSSTAARGGGSGRAHHVHLASASRWVRRCRAGPGSPAKEASNASTCAASRAGAAAATTRVETATPRACRRLSASRPAPWRGEPQRRGVGGSTDRANQPAILERRAAAMRPASQ